MKLVIGVGNSFRRDDGVGAYVTSRLREDEGTTVRTLRGDMSGVLDSLGGVHELVVIDALHGELESGRTIEWKYTEESLPADWDQGSTHGLGVLEALEMARALGTLPASVTIFGIQGKDFSQGEGLSPEVMEAADNLINRMNEE